MSTASDEQKINPSTVGHASEKYAELITNGYRPVIMLWVKPTEDGSGSSLALTSLADSSTTGTLLMEAISMTSEGEKVN